MLQIVHSGGLWDIQILYSDQPPLTSTTSSATVYFFSAITNPTLKLFLLLVILKELSALFYGESKNNSTEIIDPPHNLTSVYS